MQKKSELLFIPRESLKCKCYENSLCSVFILHKENILKICFQITMKTQSLTLKYIFKISKVAFLVHSNSRETYNRNAI